MNKAIIALLLVIVCGTSCRKVYHDCECYFINKDDKADTMLISVRATNRSKAANECAKSEMRIAEDEGFYLFCTLLH